MTPMDFGKKNKKPKQLKVNAFVTYMVGNYPEVSLKICGDFMLSSPELQWLAAHSPSYRPPSSPPENMNSS